MINFFLISAHSIIFKQIKASFQNVKDIIQKRLQSALSSIHTFLNIWISSNHHLFLRVCAHFVNNQEQHQKILIALYTVANHSEEKQSDVLLSILWNYDVIQKLSAIMRDNATINDTLCYIMISLLEEKKDLKWDSIAYHL